MAQMNETRNKTIVLDVGANNGSSCIDMALSSPMTMVYAFEPTPKMIEAIRKKTEHLSNYTIVPCAVCDYNGSAKFHIAGKRDWGCSSLNSFNDNLEKTWPGRDDFTVTDEIWVKVYRLDTFMEENNISHIDFLHVDVQGKDLEVLFGLGQYIKDVKKGVIEMPMSHEKKLYKDQKYIASDAIEFLKKNKFTITKMTYNDVFENEVNIYFEKVV